MGPSLVARPHSTHPSPGFESSDVNGALHNGRLRCCGPPGRLAQATSRYDPSLTEQQQDIMAACCTPRCTGGGVASGLQSHDTLTTRTTAPTPWWAPLEALASVAIVRQGSRAELESFSAAVRAAILAALRAAESDARWRGSGVSELLQRALQLEMSTCTHAARDLAVQLAGFKALAAQVAQVYSVSSPVAGVLLLSWVSLSARAPL
jgi:hypothetical protein